MAGGESRRMGEDKGLKLFNQKPLVTYAIHLAQSLSSTVYISTANTAYKQFGVPLINDEFPKMGPLGGIYSGLKASSSDWNLILPCDTPFLSASLFTEMHPLLADNKIVVPKTTDGRIHPLAGFYHKDIVPFLRKHIELKHLKLLRLLDETASFIYPVPKEYNACFINLNTLNDIHANEN